MTIFWFAALVALIVVSYLITRFFVFQYGETKTSYRLDCTQSRITLDGTPECVSVAYYEVTDWKDLTKTDKVCHTMLTLIAMMFAVVGAGLFGYVVYKALTYII